MATNKVFIEVDMPESFWARGACTATDDGKFRYEAKFCRTGVGSKPTHMGPAVSLVVVNAQGKEVMRRSATIGVRTHGELFFQDYKESESELEKSGAVKET